MFSEAGFDEWRVGVRVGHLTRQREQIIAQLAIEVRVSLRQLGHKCVPQFPVDGHERDFKEK